MNALPLDRHFAIRKLHSLLGIVPIGFFVCFHLFENSLATKGGHYFTEHVVHKIGDMPYVDLMEIFFIALPILFHGIYGFVIWFFGEGNVGVRSTDWRYIRYVDGSEELYDHSKDELEWHNLANDPEYAPVKKELGKWLPKASAAPAPSVKDKKKKSKDGL